MTPIEIIVRNSTNYNRKCYDRIFIFEMDSLVFALTTNAWKLTLEIGQGNKESFEVLEEYFVDYRKNQAKTNDIVASILASVIPGEATKDTLTDLVLSLNFRKLSLSPMIASVTRTFINMTK